MPRGWTGRLKAALHSELEADATVLFTLWGASLPAEAGGEAGEAPAVEREPLAEGTLSLRQLYAGGADLVPTPGLDPTTRSLAIRSSALRAVW